MIETIREFSQIEHIGRVVDMIQGQIEHNGGNTSGDKICISLKNALKKGKNSVLFLYRKDEHKYSGFAFGNVSSGLESGGDYLWINELFISEECRGGKSAAILMNYIEKWCADNEIYYMACVTGEENIRAQRFYKKSGFEVEKTVWVDKTLKK